MEREDDVQLIHTAMSGDDTAFDILIEKYQKSVHALAWRKIGGFHYAEEITQDTFLRAYQNLSTLRDPSRFLGWLYVIANRLRLNWLRKQKVEKHLQLLEDTPMEEVAESAYAHYVFDGSNFQSNLITDLDSPKGTAVDGVNRKLYWTENGGIRCANLNGENIQNVVTGLRAPASIVLSTPTVKAPIPAAPATVVIVPDATNLHPNYPNPFNPETWIPYRLSKPAEVTLQIYAVNGTLVRTLALGHQPAGVYHSRTRAAYWDGKNEAGEAVVSGIYFYTFSADDFTATRKMLILK